MAEIDVPVHDAREADRTEAWKEERMPYGDQFPPYDEDDDEDEDEDDE